MARSDIYFQVDGLDKIKKSLMRLPVKAQQNTMKKAVTFAMSPVLTAARAEAPKEFGTLKESLRKVIRIYRKGHKGGVVMGIVGVAATFGRQYSNKDASSLSDSQISAMKMRIPNMYLKRVIEGSQKRTGTDFLTRARKRTETVAKTRFKNKARKEIAKDIRKARAK